VTTTAFNNNLIDGSGSIGNANILQVFEIMCQHSTGICPLIVKKLLKGPNGKVKKIAT
jgi:hypothetical protein